MMLKNVSRLLGASALAGFFVAATAISASAATMVNFSTSAVFGSTGTNTLTLGGGDPNSATLTFAGSSLAGVNADPFSFVSFGDLTMTIAGTGYGPPDPAVNDTFTLTVTQTVPSGGSGAFSANLTGTIARTDQSTLLLTFSNTSITIGGVQYLLNNLTYPVVAPTTGCAGQANCGVTTIQGQVAATSAVPEPATMMLLGTGLLAAFRARRKIVS